jgi:membrane associated rhomboid family serine protease
VTGTKLLTVTNFLVAVNVLAFIWQLTTGGGPDYDHGYLIGIDVVQRGQWWRIFTAAFLHANLLHIGFNMIALLQVGNVVELIYGKLRFSLLYAIAIVGSGLAVITFNYTVPTLGASGAIFGLFGALVAVGLRQGQRGRSLIGQVLPVIVLNLVFTFSVPGISAAAHVGGLITGLLAGLILYMVPGRSMEAFAYASGPTERVPDGVETIEHPPQAAPHESEDAAPFEVRDPRE